jgi:uncharacterized protein (TIGR02001 family)
MRYVIYFCWTFLVMGSAVAHADIYADQYGSLSAAVALLSDYTPRGVSLSNKKPAPHFNLNYAHKSGAYADGKITRTDLNDGDQGNTETILTAGFKESVYDLNFDVSVIRYIYAGSDRARHYDFNEGRLALGKDLGFAVLTASVNYSPNYFADSGAGWDRTLSVFKPLTKEVALFGTVARQSVSNNPHLRLPDYAHWQAGLSYYMGGFTFIGQYVDTSMQKATCGGGCGPRGIFIIKRDF